MNGGRHILPIGVIVAAISGQVFLLGLQAGLASAAAALVVGVLAMFLSPPEPTPSYDYPWMAPDFDSSTDAYSAGRVSRGDEYGPDALERIEGVDVQIKGLLEQAGVRYFSQLADTSPEELREILEGGGLGTVDPTTWPNQARLAANKEWDALHKLQETLAAKQTN